MIRERVSERLRAFYRRQPKWDGGHQERFAASILRPRTGNVQSGPGAAPRPTNPGRATSMSNENIPAGGVLDALDDLLAAVERWDRALGQGRH